MRVDCERERKARVFQRLFTLLVQDCTVIVKMYSPQIEEIKIVKSSYVWISITKQRCSNRERMAAITI